VLAARAARVRPAFVSQKLAPEPWMLLQNGHQSLSSHEGLGEGLGEG
jgi:hypothetical protein